MTHSILPDFLKTLILALAGLVVLSPILIHLWGGKTRGWRLFEVFCRVASLSVLSFFAFVFDLVFGVSASWIFCAVLALIMFVVASPLPLYRRRVAASVVLGAILAGVLTLHFVDVLPIKPFVRFYGSIENGMSRDEVLALLHREFPDGGKFPVPRLYRDQPDGLSFSLDQRDYSNYLVDVSLAGGRVVGKDYCPD